MLQNLSHCYRHNQEVQMEENEFGYYGGVLEKVTGHADLVGRQEKKKEEGWQVEEEFMCGLGEIFSGVEAGVVDGPEGGF